MIKTDIVTTGLWWSLQLNESFTWSGVSQFTMIGERREERSEQCWADVPTLGSPGDAMALMLEYCS